jgi:hypothetical protein
MSARTLPMPGPIPDIETMERVSIMTAVNLIGVKIFDFCLPPNAGSISLML